jgi:hypothetical protein
VGQRHVLARDLARRDHRHEPLHGGARARHDHQPAGVLVEAVHDAGPRQQARARVAGQQGVQQRAAPVAGRGMHHQAGRLGDHQQVPVLVHHVQRQRLGQEGLALRRGPQVDLAGVAGAHLLRGLEAGAARQRTAPSSISCCR